MENFKFFAWNELFSILGQILDFWHEKVDELMEMFPSVCTSDISHCLNLMSGDIEEAAQLIHHQESRQCLQGKMIIKST